MPSDSFDSFVENSPLANLENTNTIDEYLDRINEDLVEGAVERITPERITKLVSLFRAQAEEWVKKQNEKPTRGERKKTNFADLINIHLDF